MEQVNRFWRWWTAELSSLVPHTDARGPAHRKLPLELHLSTSGASLYRRQSLHLPLTPENLVAEAPDISTLLSGRRLKGSALLSFDDSFGLRKTMILSRQLHRDADTIIASELARSTPLRAEHIATFWQELKPGSIEYVVLRLADIHATEKAARENGLTIGALAFRPSHGAAWSQIRTVDTALWQSAKDRRWRRIAAVLVLAALSSAGALAMARVSDNAATLAAIEARADRVRPEAVERRKQADAISAEISALSAVAKTRGTMPGLVPVWEELSRILPDGAWLQGLTMRDARVQIEGNARNAEALIATLEDSPLFRNVKFAAPVIDQQTAGSRFVIAFDLEGAT